MRRKTASPAGPITPKGSLVQLCFTYDQAQLASRDPKRRATQDHYLEILSDKRNDIDSLVGHLMECLRKNMYSCDVSTYTAELVYFNTWLARRGGWT